MDTALRYAGENVYTFGEIVHNKRVVNKLASLGIRMTEDVSGLKKGDTLIIRSHGAKKSVFEQCEKSGVKVVDATCPYVKVIRNKAAEYFGKGYLIVLVGDKNHPELQGINGWCGDSAVFFDGKGKLRLETDKNVLVLFQTTYESKKLMKRCKILWRIMQKQLSFSTRFVILLRIGKITRFAFPEKASAA